MEPISLRRLWSDYWKVPVVGVIAALLAFIGSFLLSPTYQSSSHLLVRARNTTFLTGNGTALSQTPGVIDSDLAKALAETQGALASTDTVARMVVADLNLDKPKPKSGGVIASLRRAAASVYKHTKAFLMYGGYKTPNRFEGAVAAVNSGLSAAQVKDSFMLELSAQADSPQLAAAIADSAAQALVTVSNRQFRKDSQNYRDLLRGQLTAAQKQEARASNAVAAFQKSHGISDVGVQLTLTAQNAANLATDLQQAKTQLSDARAQLASVQSQLATTAPRTSTSQKIVTGRSSTVVDNTTANALYQNLQSQEATLRAQVSGLEAQQGALQSAVNGAKTGAPLTKAQARLQQLALREQVAADTVQTLSQDYQQAQLQTVQNTVQLSRVDTAAKPTYPIAPRRYMFLAVGLVIGLAIGFVAAQLRVIRRRREDELLAEEAEALAPASHGGPAIDLTHAEPRNVRVGARESVTVPTLTDTLLGNGNGGGNGNGDGETGISNGGPTIPSARSPEDDA